MYAFSHCIMVMLIVSRSLVHTDDPADHPNDGHARLKALSRGLQPCKQALRERLQAQSNDGTHKVGSAVSSPDRQGSAEQNSFYNFLPVVHHTTQTIKCTVGSCSRCSAANDSVWLSWPRRPAFFTVATTRLILAIFLRLLDRVP